jgi:hypothetical protein
VSKGEAKKQKSLNLFEPQKEQFTHAMEHVEARLARLARELLLSARMRDSWDSGRFWFNLASRNSVDVDQIYWQMLHKEGRGEAMLDTDTLAGKEEFLERKEVQFKAYLFIHIISVCPCQPLQHPCFARVAFLKHGCTPKGVIFDLDSLLDA